MEGSDFLCWKEEEEDTGRDAALEVLDAARRRSGGSAGDELAAGWRGFIGSPLLFFSAWRWTEGAKDQGKERKRHVSEFFIRIAILDKSALVGPCRHYNQATAASDLWKDAAADRDLHAKVAYPAAWARRNLKFQNHRAPPYDGITKNYLWISEGHYTPCTFQHKEVSIRFLYSHGWGRSARAAVVVGWVRGEIRCFRGNSQLFQMSTATNVP